MKELLDNQSGGVKTILTIIAILVLGYFGIDISGFIDGEPDAIVTVVSNVEDSGFGSSPVDDGTVVEDETPSRSQDTTAEQPRSAATGASWYEIYFTNPTCPPEEEREGGIDEFVAADIANAGFQVDIAAFDLDSTAIYEALVSAEENGAFVRVVVDDEHTPSTIINRLRRNGISVVIDDRSALMHNKFVIIDQEVLWTGSTNFSSNGIFCNNNNLVRLISPDLAANYAIEMDEMYDDREFGARSPENTAQQLSVEGIPVENYFSPETKVAPIVASEVAQADSEILFMAFSFTFDEIGDAVLARADAGVDVRGVFETTGSETEYSYFLDFQGAGLDNLQVRQDGNGRIMHHKVFIIDRETVIFGSFNFTNSGNKTNDENTLIVRDPEFASFFIEEFELVWAEGKQ